MMESIAAASMSMHQAQLASAYDTAIMKKSMDLSLIHISEPTRL